MNFERIIDLLRILCFKILTNMILKIIWLSSVLLGTKNFEQVKKDEILDLVMWQMYTWLYQEDSI